MDDAAEKVLPAFTDKQVGGLTAGITADETYNERFVRDLPMGKAVIAIKSAHGTGKNVACSAFINSLPSDICIFQLTHCSVTETGLTIDTARHKNVVCQYESLGKVLPYRGRYVVIIDEVNAVLNQITSPCCDTHAAHHRFVNLMHRAECVVVMDVFLDNDRVNLINRYVCTKVYVIHNEYQTLSEHDFTFLHDAAQSIKLLDLWITQGLNVIIPCSSKSAAETVYAYVKTLLTEEEVQIHTSEKRCPNGSDVNAIWTKARVVVHTSDCRHSMDVEHFTHSMGYFNNNVGLSHEVAVQMMRRSRPTKVFALCFSGCVSAEYEPMSVDELIQIQHEKESRLVDTENNLYYGNMEMEEMMMKKKLIDCPYLYVRATNKMLIGKSRSSLYVPLIKELLLRDGADPTKMRDLKTTHVELIGHNNCAACGMWDRKNHMERSV